MIVELNLIVLNADCSTVRNRGFPFQFSYQSGVVQFSAEFSSVQCATHPPTCTSSILILLLLLYKIMIVIGNNTIGAKESTTLFKSSSHRLGIP